MGRLSLVARGSSIDEAGSTRLVRKSLDRGLSSTTSLAWCQMGQRAVVVAGGLWRWEAPAVVGPLRVSSSIPASVPKGGNSTRS